MPEPEDKVDVADEARAAAGEQPSEAATEDAAAATHGAEETPAAEPDPRDVELAETKDKLLRALAEMENLRRRSQKERDDTAKYAAAAFAREILPVADNLRRALDAVPDEARTGDETVKGIVEGIELVERDLLAAFERAGIRKVEPMGERFSHDLHEAMFEVPTADAAPGTVVQVMEVGYVLNDRLLRPARVGVAKATPEAANEEGVDTTA